jgi:hypothetical protein
MDTKKENSNIPLFFCPRIHRINENTQTSFGMKYFSKSNNSLTDQINRPESIR